MAACILFSMASGEEDGPLSHPVVTALPEEVPFGYSPTRSHIARPMSGRRTNPTKDPINTREVCEREVNSIARWVQRHAAASRPRGLPRLIRHPASGMPHSPQGKVSLLNHAQPYSPADERPEDQPH